MDNTRGYKAFKSGLICMGKQYGEDTVFEENGNSICEKGMMHYCTNPLDCLDYYSLIDNNGKLVEIAPVEALEEPITDDDKSYATRKLRIGAKLDFAGFVESSISFVMEHYSKGISTNRDCRKIASNEDYTRLASSGHFAQLASSGDFSGLASSGKHAQLASSGDYAQLASSGDSSTLASSGDFSKFASSGKDAKLVSSGDCTRIDSSGQNNIIMCAGVDSIAKAEKGSWVTLAEWKLNDDGQRYVPVCVKTEFVDGEKIKANIWYKLENGEFVIAEGE